MDQTNKTTGKTEADGKTSKVQAQELAKNIGAKITAKGRRISVVFEKPCIRCDSEGKEYFYIEPNTEYVRGDYSQAVELLNSWITEAQKCLEPTGDTTYIPGKEEFEKEEECSECGLPENECECGCEVMDEMDTAGEAFKESERLRKERKG